MEPAEKLKGVVTRAINKRKPDLEATIKEAARLARALNDPQVDELLWQRGLAEQVYDARHSLNQEVRAQTQVRVLTTAEPKVLAGNSPTVSGMGKALAEYDYYIAGQLLGDLKGAQLVQIAEAEEARANGHSFNANLLRRLDKIVPESKTVRQSVKPNKLKAIFIELQTDGSRTRLKKVG